MTSANNNLISTLFDTVQGRTTWNNRKKNFGISKSTITLVPNPSWVHILPSSQRTRHPGRTCLQKRAETSIRHAKAVVSTATCLWSSTFMASLRATTAVSNLVEILSGTNPIVRALGLIFIFLFDFPFPPSSFFISFFSYLPSNRTGPGHRRRLNYPNNNKTIARRTIDIK